MAGVTVRIEGERALLQGIRELAPSAKVLRDSLLEMAQLTTRIAAQEKIKRGGKQPPVRGVLTSRTGTLRRSLTGARAIDRSGLPDSIEFGTNLVYAAVHEFGHKRKGIPIRPFLAPALRDALPKFEAIFEKHWQREMPK